MPIMAVMVVWISGYGQDFSEGFEKFRVKRKWGFMDETFKVVIKPKYINAGNFSEGLVKIQKEVFANTAKWGFIDKTGKVVIAIKYENVGDFSEGMASIQISILGTWKKWGFVDKTGKEIIKPKYEEANNFSEGLASVKMNGKWGFVDKNGNEVIPIKYERVGDFSEGLANIKMNGKWGIIDKNGNEVIPAKYDRPVNFSEEWAKIFLNEKSGFVDKNGNEYFPDYSNYNKIMRESLLLVHIEEINKYQSKLEKKYHQVPFQIHRPYVVMATGNLTNLSVDKMSLYDYSEIDFNEININDVKTIIIVTPFVYYKQSYTSIGNSSLSGIKTSFGRCLIYFDMEKKKCIGYDKISGPSLPEITEELNPIYLPMAEILPKIKSHLTISEK